jgi:hypothetical protein
VIDRLAIGHYQRAAPAAGLHGRGGEQVPFLRGRRPGDGTPGRRLCRIRGRTPAHPGPLELGAAVEGARVRRA